MWSFAREISEGDLVIVWQTRDSLQPIVVTSGKELNNKFGTYRHSDLIGLPYGSKVGSRNGKGFIHVLRPTPELWTMALPHRTQILYLADIAFVTMYLDIRPGSKVVEAGTGSGSFSHSVARTIGINGHLWTYEFHEARVNKAREEFKQHGMAEIVTLTHRNVCKDGFTVEGEADSVFLDLPAPWDAVESAKKALRKDRPTRICCFSPCMEQVLRTVSALNDAGFSDITMYETLSRPQDVSQVPVPLTILEVRESLRKAEQKREEKRLRQIETGRNTRNDPHRGKRKRDDGSDEPTENGDAEGDASKRIKLENEPQMIDVEADASTEAAIPISLVPTTSEQSESQPVAKVNISKPYAEVRGHTSYLTFACLLPPLEPEPAENGTVAAELTPI